MDNWRNNQDISLAVCEGNLERVRELIYSFGRFYSRGYFLLRLALRNKHAAVAKLLLANGSEVIGETSKPLDTPLHLAVMNGDIEIVNMILEKGANIEARNQFGQTPLHVAVEKGDTEVVTLLLSRGANIDVKDEDDVIPLHIAAKNGSIRIAEYLLSYGACIHSSTLTERYTPLHFASELDNEETVQFLLDRGADVNAKTKDDSTPLHIATKRKREKVVKLLLQHGAEVDDQDKNGETTLNLAVERGNSTIVKDILNYCPDINDKSNRSSLKIAVHGYGEVSKNIVESLLQYGFVVNPEDANDPMLLHAAVEKGYLKIVEDLLKYGADVNALHKSSYNEGFTPLHSAARNSQEEIAKLLISYEADVNAQNKIGKTPIFYAVHNADSKITKLLLTNRADIKGNPELLNIAVRTRCIEIIETLLQHGADINASDDYGRTALHSIVLSENDINIKEEIAKLLLSKGANVDAKTINGTTTLHAAVQRGYAKIVEALLEYSANIDYVVNIEQKDGMTPLHLAAQEGHEEIVKILLEYGAKVDSNIKNDKTSLHLAAEKGSPKIIEILLNFGADIDSRDEDGRTALHIASDKGYDDVVQILLDYGSDINMTSKNNDTALVYALLGSRSLDNSCRRANGYKLTIENLQRHINKMRGANLYVNPALLRSKCNALMHYIYEPIYFKNQCKREIAKMKRTKMNNLTISFYDILTKDTSSLAMYMRNENVVLVSKSDDYKTKFPIYTSMIRNNFKKGMVRKELFEQGIKIFHLLSNNLPELPYDCAEEIISYLSDDDLRIFINACRALGIGNFNTNSND